MAKRTTSTHEVRFGGDFSDVVRAAQKAAKKSSEIISAAMKVGLKGSYTTQIRFLQQFDRRRTELEKEYRRLSEVLDAKRTNKYEKQLESTIRDISRLTRDLNNKDLKDEVKKTKIAEIKKLREKQRNLKKFSKTTEAELLKSISKLKNEMGEVMTEQAKVAQSISRATERATRGTEHMKKIMGGIREITNWSADEWTDSIEDGLQRLRSGISSFNLSDIITGVASRGGRMTNILGDLMGGAGAKMGGGMGALAVGLSRVMMIVGPLVAGLGILTAVVLDLDKQTKEFSKSAINAFGTQGIMNLGQKTLVDNLKILRRVTGDFTATLGLSEQEALGFFDALEAGGVTFNRLTKGVRDATTAQDQLKNTMHHMVATSKALGVEINSFASTTAEYMDTLTFSLEDVAMQFGMIAKQAQEAGFSTRRFYSLITQAMAGQASFNTRLDDTAELMIKMTKVLGEKQAAEVLGGAAGSFKELGTQDRYRMMMTTGLSRTKRVIQQSARHQAATFLGRSDLDVSKLREAMADSGVVLDPEVFADKTGEKLVAALSQMSRADQGKMLAAITSSNDKQIQAQGRALDQLVRVTRGTSGNIADMSDALSALDPGATIAMKLQGAMAVLGRPLHELNGIQRMAAEQITGISGAQFEQYQAIAAQAEGTWAILNQAKKQGEVNEARNKELAARYGAAIKDGQIVAARIGSDGQLQTGEVIRNSMDFFSTVVERQQSDLAEAAAKNMDLAYESFEATVTIGEILENKILYYLRGLYEDIGQPILMWIQDTLGLGTSKKEREASISARAALQDEIRYQQKRISESGSVIQRLEFESRRGELTDEKKARLEQARRTRDEAQAIIEAATAEIRKQAMGDFSSLRGKETYTTIIPRRFHVVEETITKDVIITNEELIRSIRKSAAGTAEISETVQTPPAASTAPTTRATSGAVQTSPAASTAPTTRATSGAVQTSPAASTAPTTRATTEDQTGQITQTTMEASESISETTSREASETRSTIEDEGQGTRDHLTKIFTRDRKLGNALARSDLPQAIVDAQVKQQLMSLAFAAGLKQEDVAKTLTEFYEKGTISDALADALIAQATEGSPLAAMAASAGINISRLSGEGAIRRYRLTGSTDSTVRDTEKAEVTEGVDDFIYRGDGVRGTITPIDSEDQVIGMKRGGPIDRAMGGGGNVVVNIYGGDERRVYDVVKRVLTQTGIGPSRVTSRA